MQTYYRKPRPDLLMGALVEGMRASASLLGPAALPSAVFLSHVLRAAVRTSDAAAGLLARCVSASGSASPPKAASSAAGSEALDTLLRAMRLSGAPHLQTCVEAASRQWTRAVRDLSGDEEASRHQEHECLTRSLREGSGAPFLTWPVPALGVTAFQATIEGTEFPVWGATRHLFLRTHAFHVMARHQRPRFVATLPDLASLVTTSMLDGYWAHFYATGDALTAVTRVLDVATPYCDFVEEYGDVWVTHYAPSLRDSDPSRTAGGVDVSGAPPEFDDDPYNRMKFVTSRYALWSLLVHAATHTAVGDCFARLALSAHDRAALVSPLTRAGTITAFGERQLQLMQLIFPAVQDLRVRATESGIGSGQWPATYEDEDARRRRGGAAGHPAAWGEAA